MRLNDTLCLLRLPLQEFIFCVMPTYQMRQDESAGTVLRDCTVMFTVQGRQTVHGLAVLFEALLWPQNMHRLRRLGLCVFCTDLNQS